MKHIFICIIGILLSLQAYTQQNMLTASGGYSFATIEDTDHKATGWRINGLYEFNPILGMFAHGVSFGYINVTASYMDMQTNVESKISSIPIYYAPKVMFGNDKIKGFIKGALGMQFSFLKRTALVELTDNDFGFYGGGGAGLMFNVTETVFINAEYEIAWLSNSYYKDGWMNTAMGGIGIRF
jgi:opacity protein-like surface antigen